MLIYKESRLTDGSLCFELYSYEDSITCLCYVGVYLT